MNRASILLGAAVSVMLAGATTGESASRHFALSKSAPEADAVVQAPSEVRLWFTEEPQESTISIRVVDGHGDVLETGEVTQDADEATVFSVSLDRTLGMGSYTVAWRGIGPDGHAVRGDFAFTVDAR